MTLLTYAYNIYIQQTCQFNIAYTVFEGYRPMSGSNACRHNTWHTGGVVARHIYFYTVSTAGARQTVTIDRSNWQVETDVLKCL